MLTNRKTIRIEWGDCDPGGIAYFPRYFEYLDSCTNALFECAGLPKRQMMETYGIAGIPLVESHARFVQQQFFGSSSPVQRRSLGRGSDGKARLGDAVHRPLQQAFRGMFHSGRGQAEICRRGAVTPTQLVLDSS